ncbi:MAG: class I SAM-dependent methyltransferase [Bacillus sp. (in: firmicutes)]
MSTKGKVKSSFNEHAAQYDQLRKKLIPCFDDFYSIPVSLLPDVNEAPSVLDIGAGTGLMASFVKEKFPKAKMDLIDLAENMLEIAKQRFADDENMEYIVGDYTQYVFEKKYDIVVSSLSIHHLTDEEKRALYTNVFRILNDGGIFVNADQVLGENQTIDNLYKADWCHKIENSGLTKQEIQAAYERTKLDKMSTLSDQLQWLKDSGFSECDCMYKYFNFVVLWARK